MSVFISYKYSGESPSELESFHRPIFEELKQEGFDPFHSLFWSDYFKEHQMSDREMMSFCLDHLRESRVMLAIVRDDRSTNGMDVERRVALQNDIRIILAIRAGCLQRTFRRSAKTILEYHNASVMETDARRRIIGVVRDEAQHLLTNGK